MGLSNHFLNQTEQLNLSKSVLEFVLKQFPIIEELDLKQNANDAIVRYVEQLKEMSVANSLFHERVSEWLSMTDQFRLSLNVKSSQSIDIDWRAIYKIILGYDYLAREAFFDEGGLLPLPMASDMTYLSAHYTLHDLNIYTGHANLANEYKNPAHQQLDLLHSMFIPIESHILFLTEQAKNVCKQLGQHAHYNYVPAAVAESIEKFLNYSANFTSAVSGFRFDYMNAIHIQIEQFYQSKPQDAKITPLFR